MIEEVTPQVVTASLLLVTVSAAILTLLVSALLLWLYRRAVTREMAVARDVHGTLAAPFQPAASSRSDTAKPLIRAGGDLSRRAIRGPWHSAMRYGVAGLGLALVFAVAARFVYPFRTDLAGFLIGVWIYTWPVVLALWLIVPGSMRLWAACAGGYFVVLLLLGLWAASIADMPEFRFGGVVLPARSAVTPRGMTSLWLVVNAGPTALVGLCFNRWVRAVAPLVLALVATVISGTWIGLLALFSPRGVEAAVALAVALKVNVYWLVLATVVLALAGFGVGGWALARWIARAYRRRTVSDQSLTLDALWLLFASSYAMWLVLGGLAWMATAPAAFVAYKLVLGVGDRLSRPRASATRGLTFLRVFSLGRRTDRLLDTVARYWRHIGSVQMITGPDVAQSTVQPHQFLDFLSGRLASHFVGDRGSLERSLAERSSLPDSNGRFRINNFFCHADSWQHVVPRLVEDGDAVLMDLRGFSARNAGCIHELRYLTRNVPFDRCALIVDDTTDQDFLHRTLTEAWAQLSPDSPNHGRSRDETAVHRFEPGNASVQRLVRRLCEARVGPGEGDP